MSRSLSVNILLPMNEYSSSNIYDKDGKLLVSLIIGQYIAKRVSGIAVAEYS